MTPLSKSERDRLRHLILHGEGPAVPMSDTILRLLHQVDGLEDPEQYISVADAAALIGCEPRNVRILCKAGTIVARQSQTKRGSGNEWEVLRSSVEEWAKRKGRGRPRSVLEGVIVR